MIHPVTVTDLLARSTSGSRSHTQVTYCGWKCLALHNGDKISITLICIYVLTPQCCCKSSNSQSNDLVVLCESLDELQLWRYVSCSCPGLFDNYHLLVKLECLWTVCSVVPTVLERESVCTSGCTRECYLS